MITLENVSKEYSGHLVVNHLSLRIQPGEIFGLVGPDGAGKTTTLRMITGIINTSSGTITVLGTPNVEQIKDRIGYIPQKFSLYGDLTVRENIQFIGSMYGADHAQISAASEEILRFTNLFPFQDRLADQLSGGMKQKLALAAGLMHKPEIFFLDEPTTGVDPVSRREFWQMLYKLNKDGMTIVVSTPYMDEAELCTRVAFLHNGKMVSCDTPEKLRAAYPYQVLELTTPEKNINRILQNCPILDSNPFGAKHHLIVKDAAIAAPAVTAALTGANVAITSLRVIAPTLEDVFVELAGEN